MKKLDGITGSGNPVDIPVRVAEVSRTLFSVREMKGNNTKPLNMVVFGIDEDHEIVNRKTKEVVFRGGKDAVISNGNYTKSEIIDTGKDYVLDIWLRKPEERSVNWLSNGHGVWKRNETECRTIKTDEAPF